MVPSISKDRLGRKAVTNDVDVTKQVKDFIHVTRGMF